MIGATSYGNDSLSMAWRQCHFSSGNVEVKSCSRVAPCGVALGHYVMWYNDMFAIIYVYVGFPYMSCTIWTAFGFTIKKWNLWRYCDITPSILLHFHEHFRSNIYFLTLSPPPHPSAPPSPWPPIPPSLIQSIRPSPIFVFICIFFIFIFIAIIMTSHERHSVSDHRQFHCLFSR